MNAAEILGAQPQQEAQPQAPDFDKKFAHLAKMEKEMRTQREQFSSREKEWDEKGKKLSEYEELMKLMDENPIEAIKKRKGWGLQELNEFAVKNSTDEDLDPVAQITKNFQTKMEEMRKALTEEFEGKIKSKEEEYSSKDRDYQINQFKGSIKEFLLENKDTYEFVNAYGAEGNDLVYDVIYTDVINRKERGEENLTPMAFKDAADKVESYLDEQAQKFLNLNKVRSKFSSDKLDLDKIVNNAHKTINNSFVPSSKNIDQLSPEERRKNAEDLVKSWLR